MSELVALYRYIGSNVIIRNLYQNRLIKTYFNYLFNKLCKKCPNQYYVIDLNINSIKFKMKVNPVKGLVDKSLYFSGIYENKLTNMITNSLHKGFVFVDIGANIGYYSLIASGLVGSKGKVISFEPVWKIYNKLNNNIVLNKFKNIKTHNVALGDKKEIKTINLVPHNEGGNSFNIKYWGATEDVVIQTFQNIIKEKVDVIKIDVEGYEAKIISSMKSYLYKYKPILFIEIAYESISNEKDYNSLIEILHDIYTIKNVETEEIISKYSKNKLCGDYCCYQERGADE